jgi:hypothetical protein
MAPMRATGGEKTAESFPRRLWIRERYVWRDDLNYTIYVQLSQSSMIVSPFGGTPVSQSKICRSDPARLVIRILGND